MSVGDISALPALPLGRPIPDLSENEFSLFRALILRESGIHLGGKNRAMLISRLWRRLRALDLASFAAYYRRVLADPAELVLMLDCVCTNETHFFREPAAFDCLRQVVFPQWRAAADAAERNRVLRVWSAACSSGEEPYSLAMLLLCEFPPESGWKLEVLGTDLSTKVLDRAARGVWSFEKIREVPVHYQHRFFVRGHGLDARKVQASDELRRVVRFERLNLTHEPCAARGPFDLIFCRNVLIYFDWETKIEVVNRLGRQLARGGYMFLGHAESLHGVNGKLESVSPKFFRMPRTVTRTGALSILERRADSQPARGSTE